jgi:hypothetical protein
MGAADERVTQLLERWLASVELHARYLALDDAAYARAQDWPKHQRPTRWVVELARTRLLEIRRLLADRQARGDEAFAEALELMAFLTNLLGSEHVERFIPLAQAAEPTVETRASRQPAKTTTARRAEPRAPTATRASRTQGPARRQATPSQSPAPPRPEPERTAHDKVTATVIADAVRLVSWGREWPQIAGLIARLANRPPEAEVWKILRTYRAQIEARARRPRD